MKQKGSVVRGKAIAIILMALLIVTAIVPTMAMAESSGGGGAFPDLTEETDVIPQGDEPTATGEDDPVIPGADDSVIPGEGDDVIPGADDVIPGADPGSTEQPTGEGEEPPTDPGEEQPTAEQPTTPGEEPEPTESEEDVPVVQDAPAGYTDMASRLQLDGDNKIISAYTANIDPQPASIFIPKQAYNAGGDLVDIKGIADNAFASNAIGSIYFDPANVIETIGNGAFQSRIDMTIANNGFISNSLKSIGSSAFQNSGITKIQLPDTLETIGTYAFAQSKLQSLDIPSKITVLPSNMLAQVKTLTSITLPSGLKTIKTGVFSEFSCPSECVIKIPSGITTIEDSFISWAGQNVSIDVSDWAYPGDIAWGQKLSYFYGNVLYKDDDPSSWWYFNSTTGQLGGIKPMAAAVKLVDGTTDNPEYNPTAFPGSTLSLADYPINAAHELVIPASFGTSPVVPVTEIVPNAFGYYPGDNFGVGLYKKYRYIKTLSFAEPSSITTIGNGAFWNAQKLTSITLPSSLKTIKNQAFAYSYILENVNIPATVTTIANLAFYSNYVLGNVTFEGTDTTSKISSIVSDAFGACAALYDIYFEGKTNPASSIANPAPAGASWGAVAATVHYSNEDTPAPDIYTDGPWVYNEATQTIVGYKYGATGGGYLGGSPNNADLVIPSKLSRPLASDEIGYISDTSDPNYPAVKETNILTISRPTMDALRIKLNGAKAFNSVTIQEGIETIDGFDQMVLTNASLSIPASATTINTLAFRSTGLASVEFVGANNGSSKLTYIGSQAFETNKFTTLVFPEGLQTIADRAFNSSYGLLKGNITIPSTVTSIGGSAFNGHKFNTAASGDPVNGITQFTVLMSRADAPAAVKNGGTWGATPGTGPVVYNASQTGISVTGFAKIPNPSGEGDTANLSYSVNLPFGDYINNIEITGPTGYTSLRLPASGDLSYLTNTLNSSFVVDRNGTYTLTLHSKLGETITTTYDVTTFGVVTITSEDNVVINIANYNDIFGDGTGKKLSEVTVQQLITLAQASAIDKDTGNDAGLSITTADRDLVRALATDGDSEDITLSAAYVSAYNGTNTATKTVRFLFSGKIYRTFNVRAGDVGIGKFTGGDTDTTKVNEYSSALTTVSDGDIPTPITDDTNAKKDYVKFLGWYQTPDTLINNTHAGFKSAIVGGAVGTQSITYEARFIIDEDDNGTDDRLEGRTTFNYVPAKGTVTYNSATPTVGTDGVIAVAAGSFSVQAVTPANVLPVGVTVSSLDYQFKGWKKGSDAPISIGVNTLGFVPGTVANPEIYDAVFYNGIKFVWSTTLADGSGTSYVYVPQGGTIGDEYATAPTPAAKASLQFDGWATDVETDGNGKGATQTVPDVNSDPQSGPKTYYAKFSEAPIYSVTYDAGTGGTLGTATGKTGVRWSDKNLVPATSDTSGVNPTKTGYTLSGWKVADAGSNVDTETLYSALTGADKTSTTAILLVAQWAAKDVTVNFNPNATNGVTAGSVPSVSGTFDKSLSTSNVPASAPGIGAGAPTRTGYTFAGWSTNSGIGNTANFNDSTPLNGALLGTSANDASPSITVYAVWQINTPDPSWATVTFSANGGAPATVPAPILYNKVSLAWADGTVFPASPATDPTRPGYTFDSWNATIAGDGAAISTLDGLLPITANKTVYAKWNIDTTQTTHWTTVSFDANGGVVASAPAPILYNITEGQLADGVTFPQSPADDPSRGGYIFDEWNEQSDGSGAKVAAITDLGTISGPVTVWAKWLVDTTYPQTDWYYVTFDAKGGSAASTIHVHKTDHILGTGESWPTTARTGYTFGQWEDSAGTPYVLADMASLSQDLDLIATWTIDPGHPAWNTVAFDGNGSSAANLPADLYYNTSESAWADGTAFPASTIPTRDGYTFKTSGGWNTKANGTGANTASLDDLVSVAKSATPIVYAQWDFDGTSSVWNTVTFDANGGSGAPAAIYYNVTESDWRDGTVFPSATPTRTGYTFGSWNKTVNGSGQTVSDLAVLVADVAISNTTVFAYWTLDTYKITYKLNGGTNDSSNPDDYDVTQLPISIKNPTREGYTFDGWTATGGLTIGTETKSAKIPKDTTGNITFTAHWTIKTYTVTYIGNGHTSGTEPAATTHNHGSNATVKTQETLARDSHSFSGWNTAADGSGSAYAAGSAISNITGNQTLYAQWTYNAPPTDPPEDPDDPDDPPRRPEDPDDDPDDPPVVPPAPPVDPPADPTPPAQTEVVTPEPEAPEAATSTNINVSGFSNDDAGKLEAQSGNILNNLANGNVPLGNFFGNGAWSLLDLILAVIAAVLSIYLIVGAVLKRRRDQGIDYYTEEEVKQQGNVLKVLAIATGILTVVVCLILDDLSTPVTWINKWTLPVAIIFIVHIAAFFAYKIRAHKIAD